ncbi:hypothetical protein IWZ03DRAFT_359061 [Phyllosticta citriasiana]|uniref:MYND-type domain-containing protein n=1 Tax=Phyllosticta citriasiana TaxID=595635 RepID=A0ABR1KPG4_9PEZI
MADEQSPPPGPPDPCLICLNPEGRLCGACHSVAYCSKDCQNSDWKSHKNICSQVVEELERPKGNFKRAIIFKPDDDKPRLVWLEVQRIKDPDDEEKSRLSTARPIADFLACRQDAVSGVGFQRNVRRGRDLEHTLIINFYERYDPNYSVREATDVRNFHDFMGPVIFSKKTGFTPDGLDYGDIEATDYLDIIDFLITFGNPIYRDRSYLLPSTRFESNFDLAADFRKLVLNNDTSDKQDDDNQSKQTSERATEDKTTVQCVRIACEGDLRGGSTKLKHVVLPMTDASSHSIQNVPSSKAYHASHISQLVGMPLHLRRVMREHGDNETNHANPEATLLLHELHDMSSDSWGWPPPQWQAHYGIVGSVVAMRDDGEDLTIQQVRELCEFARLVARPLTNSAFEGDVKPDDVRRHYLTREKMDDFVRMKRLGKQE